MSRPPNLIRRVDDALAKMKREKMGVRAIYLSPSDYAAYQRYCTRRWRRRSGSTAEVWPLSYGKDGLPIIGERLVPVRQSRSRTIIYSAHGVGVHVPKRVPGVR